jgi:prepilin-type N-terminal cleavage/methylation domain-containing protein
MRPACARRRAWVSGFTLVELAVVMTVVALLLASLMYTLSAQVEQRNFEETRRRLDQARELLLSFAIVNGRLPCPGRYTSSASHSQGFESFCVAATGSCAGSETTTVQTHGNCSNFYDGFIPAATIGITSVDSSGFAVDAWGNRIRYAVAKTNVACATSPPANTYLFSSTTTSPSNVRNYGISCQPNDLLVCKSATGIGAACGGAANQIMSQSLLVAIVFSTGKNFATAPDAATATAAGRTDESANLNGDAVFVSHPPTPSGFANGEFDDQFTWITVGELYGKLIAAGLLP